MKMSVNIQYVSDIHLEFLDSHPKIECLVENLCLLGDIGHPSSGIYKTFIRKMSEMFKNVFVIFGNHEYYQSHDNPTPMSEIEEDTVKWFPNNVYFLQNTCVYIHPESNIVSRNATPGSIKIIGSTLWSDITDYTAVAIHDYGCIYTAKTTLLTPEYSRALFHSSKRYILNEIASEPDLKCVLLTHHGAHLVCCGKYRGGLYDSAFSTDIPELLECKNLVACINGHTHSNISTVVNGIQFLSNCYGFSHENPEVVQYSPHAVLSV